MEGRSFLVSARFFDRLERFARIGDEIFQFCAEGALNLERGGERRVSSAAFQKADVIARKPRFFSQRLLAQAGFTSQMDQSSSKGSGFAHPATDTPDGKIYTPTIVVKYLFIELLTIVVIINTL